MRVLLTNDDGIHAPGLAAMEKELRGLGDLTVAAPSTEQSGVGHAITFLTPLTKTSSFLIFDFIGSPVYETIIGHQGHGRAFLVPLS